MLEKTIKTVPSRAKSTLPRLQSLIHSLAYFYLIFSLKNNGVREYVKTEGMKMNTFTCSDGESEPTTAIVQEIPVVIVTVDESAHKLALQNESITTVKEIQTEGEIIHGIAHELSLEVQTAKEFVPEFAVEIENISAVREIPFEEEIVCGITHEISLEEQTVSEIVPEIAIEVQNVSSVRDIPFEEEIVCGITQELSLEEETVNRDFAVPEIACGIERISACAVKEIPFEHETVRRIPNEISSEEQTVSTSTHELAIEEEAVDETTNEIPLEEEMVNVMSCEISTEIPLESAEVEPAFNKVISDDVPLLVDSSAKKCPTSISLETKAFATPAEKSFVKSCSVGMNAKTNEFVPQKTRLSKLTSFGGVSDGTATEPTVKNRVKTTVDVAGKVEDPVELNARAKEFVPSSGGASGGTVAAKHREKTVVGLNARTKEFVPSSGGASGGIVVVPSGSDKPERSLNAFAREFVPSNFRSNAAVHPNNAPVMAPVYRPASPRPATGFRPRGQAVIQRRLPSGRFLPIHPRVRPRFHGPQQVMRPRWSTADR